MFYYLAYDVRISLNTIFFVKVPFATGVFLSLSFLFNAFLFFPSTFFLAFFFSIFLASFSYASASSGRARIINYLVVHAFRFEQKQTLTTGEASNIVD